MVKALSPFLHTPTYIETLHIAQVYTRVHTSREKKKVKMWAMGVYLGPLCPLCPLSNSTPVGLNPASFSK